jgi:hypothetical protein
MPRGIYLRPVGYRPRKTDSPELVERVKLLYSAGKTQDEIATVLGRSRKFVQGVFRRNGMKARVAAKRDQRGPRNSSWKGDRAGYQALHLRVYQAKGRPTACSVCGTTTARAFDWANLTGNYQDITDYAAMCRSCHWRYDGTVQNLRR